MVFYTTSMFGYLFLMTVTCCCWFSKDFINSGTYKKRLGNHGKLFTLIKKIYSNSYRQKSLNNPRGKSISLTENTKLTYFSKEYIIKGSCVQVCTFTYVSSSGFTFRLVEVHFTLGNTDHVYSLLISHVRKKKRL